MILAAATLSLGMVACCSTRGARTSDGTGAPSGPYRDGFYAILGESSTQDSVRAAAPNAPIVIYDRVYADVIEPIPPVYVAIDTTFFIPLTLSGPPEARKDEKGWTLLSVSLSRDQVKPLEEFTRAHLGGKVAILLDGDVISTHKIREVITEGKIQISRCGDNACDVLRAKLTN